MPFLILALASSAERELDAAELASQIKNGDQEAFRNFFERHQESLFRYLRSRNMDKETAEDLIQQAFVYIWEHRDGIDPDKSLRSYLFRIAYTRMLNHIRNNRKFDDSKEQPAGETHQTPEDKTRARDLEKAIRQTLKSMPEKRSRVFELCFLEEFTYREAAEVLDVSVKTIENHMGLAFKDMRKALQNFL